MSLTSPVRVQFLGKVVDMPIVLQFFDDGGSCPCCAGAAFAIGSRSWRCAADQGGNREGAQSSFLLCSYGVLTASCGTCLDVVFWLSVTELSLAQITGR